MAFPTKSVPMAKVAQGNVPMMPTRGTVAPTDLDKNTTAVKPVGKPTSMTKPRGLARGGRY